MPGSLYVMLFLVFVLYVYALVGMRRGVRLRYFLSLILGLILDGWVIPSMAAHGSGKLTTHAILGAVAWILMFSFTGALFYIQRNGVWPPPADMRGIWKFGVASFAIWLFSLVTGYATHVATIDRCFHLIGG